MTPAHPRIPYGEADFRRIRRNRWLYVDKTRFLRRLDGARHAGAASEPAGATWRAATPMLTAKAPASVAATGGGDVAATANRPLR